MARYPISEGIDNIGQHMGFPKILLDPQREDFLEHVRCLKLILLDALGRWIHEG